LFQLNSERLLERNIEHREPLAGTQSMPARLSQIYSTAALLDFLDGERDNGYLGCFGAHTKKLLA